MPSVHGAILVSIFILERAVPASHIQSVKARSSLVDTDHSNSSGGHTL